MSNEICQANISKISYMNVSLSLQHVKSWWSDLRERNNKCRREHSVAAVSHTRQMTHSLLCASYRVNVLCMIYIKVLVLWGVSHERRSGTRKQQRVKRAHHYSFTLCCLFVLSYKTHFSLPPPTPLLHLFIIGWDLSDYQRHAKADTPTSSYVPLLCSNGTLN
jgi:hypothetical protein